jgi:hypothetical protein
LRDRSFCGTVSSVAATDPLARAVRAATKALDRVDPKEPADALPHLREAVDQLTKAIDEAMAAVVLDEGGTLRLAGSLAGLSENAVGPRLARTSSLAPYASKEGRVTARGVERALYDKEVGRAPAPAAAKPPMRFKPRRPSSD